MNKPNEQPQDTEEMRAEYDFSRGVRGKYHKAYRKGCIVRVHKADGTVTEQRFPLEEGATISSDTCQKE